MVQRNTLTAVLNAAKTLPDNIAVQKLVEKVKLAQTVVLTQGVDQLTVNPFAGYEMAASGEDGYGLMINPPSDLLTPFLRKMNHHHELAVTADCLASVLMALDIPIEGY